MFFSHPNPKGDPMNLVPKSYVKPNSPMPTILVVDDNPYDLDILLINLKNFGFSVITVQDGEGALTQVRDHRPDLILMDLILPRIDGLETCRRLKADQSLRGIPVIFMIPLEDREVRGIVFQTGAADFITKPLQSEEIQARIRSCLAVHTIQQELAAREERLQQVLSQRLEVERSLKASEEKYRILVENSTDAILMLDKKRRIISFNPAFLQLFGYKHEEIEGKSVRIIHPSDDSFKAFGESAYPIVEKAGFFRTEWNFIRKDATAVPVETITSPIKSPEGSLIGFVAVIRDITARRQAEKELQRYREQLEELVSERTAELTEANKHLQKEIADRLIMEEALQSSAEKIKLFAYSVSHDLKSPAIGMVGLTRFLFRRYRTVLDERGQRVCDQLLQTAEQITALVEMINLYMTTKSTPLKLERLNPKKIFQMVRDEFSIRLKNSQIRWLEPENVPEVSADQTGMLRIFRNLVDNALKYGGDQLTEIRINYKASGQFHIFSVSNDGASIRRESSEKIFDPFQRDETSKRVEGTGLGLAIVKELADHHGGRVWMESRPGQGTTFYVSISKNLGVY